MIINNIGSTFEEIIAINDFLQKDSLKIHIFEHELRKTIFNNTSKTRQLISLLGRGMVQLTQVLAGFP